jgi:hypothetical protein
MGNLGRALDSVDDIEQMPAPVEGLTFGAPGVGEAGVHVIEVDDVFPVWFFHPWARIFTACWVILADMVMVSSRSCAAISSTQAD